MDCPDKPGNDRGWTVNLSTTSPPGLTGWSILTFRHRWTAEQLCARRHLRLGPGRSLSSGAKRPGGRGDSHGVLVLSIRSKALLVDTPT